MKRKNIMLSILIALLGIVSYSAKAQVNNTRQESTQSTTPLHKDVQNNNNEQKKTHEHQMDYSKMDYITMQNGKMVINKDGNKVPMEKEMTMKNGTKYMTDGTCVTKDGKTTMLKEGEMIDMNGKMIMILKKKDKINNEN